MSDNPVKKPETSGSRAARVMLCPASRHAPDIPIDGGSERANLGSAVHEVLSDVVLQNLDVLPDLHAYASNWAIKDQDELRMLSYFGLQAWRDLRKNLKVLHVEHQMKDEAADFILTGKADVIAESTDLELCVVDWKSGYVEQDTRDQLMTYICLAAVENMNYVKFKGVVVWLRTREIEVIEVTPVDLKKWLDQLRTAMHGEAFNPGAHCQYCPLAHECKARAALVQSAATDLAEIQKGELPITPEALGVLYPRAQLLEKALKNYKEVLKATIEDHGPLSTGDGRVLTYEDKNKDQLSLILGWDDIASALGEPSNAVHDVLHALENAGALKLGKTNLLKMVSDAAPRGQKGKVKTALMEALKECNAVTVNVTKQLTIRKGAPDGQGN